MLLLEAECHRDGRWVFILDQTCCSHQGPSSGNTYSTGNRLRRPRLGRRYGRKRYTPRQVHAFVMGLLITPSGWSLHDSTRIRYHPQRVRNFITGESGRRSVNGRFREAGKFSDDKADSERAPIIRLNRSVR